MATFIRMPQKGLTEESAILAKWYVTEGQTVSEGQYIFALETGKATFDVETEVSGTVLKLIASEGDEVPIKKIVCVIGSPGENFIIPDTGQGPDKNIDANIDKDADKGMDKNKNMNASTGMTGDRGSSFSPETPVPRAAVLSRGKIKISPRARRLALAQSLDYSRIPGTGPGGRIIEEDVKAAIAAAGRPAPLSAVTPSASAGEYTAVPNDTIRKSIAARMLASMQGMAQFTMHAHFDASQLLSWRERHNQAMPPEEKLTINDLLAFAVSRVLPDFPRLNAHFHDGQTLLFSRVNLGIAVDTPRGLLVPTLRGADTKSLAALSREIKTLAQRCREGKALPEDLSDGTFTISNIGAYSVDYFTPIINPPQTAILGIGAPGYERKKTAEGMTDYPAIYLSLTADHRAVDGAPGAAFLKALCDRLENFPLLLAG